MSGTINALFGGQPENLEYIGYGDCPQYGDEFTKKYDMLNRGEPIGGIAETVEFIEKVEAVKDKYGKRRKR